jgi:predicted nucleic acid-binding protein
VNAVVVDTDVVSYLFKQDSRALLYQPHLQNRLVVISFMTVAELDRWVIERNWGAERRKKMEEHLRKFVVLPYDRNLCTKWAEVSDSARRNGREIQCADAWIAATAILHGVPLITNNRDDYIGVTGLTIISETQPVALSSTLPEDRSGSDR